MAGDTAISGQTAPRIRLEHVTKTYRGRGGVTSTAVEDVTLDVPAGEITVLVGSSGSGKTTLLRSVNRMVTPTSGAVLVDDTDVAQLDPVQLRRRIGYVMQESGLLPHRTVGDNIATVPRLTGVSKEESRARALEMLDLVGLDRALSDRYPAELSGGQRQRVGVARALANKPRILLMDEPFGAVDPIVRADLQNQIRELQRVLGCTILFVTHDIAEALTLGDRIVLLAARGEIVQQGSASDLLTNPANDFVRDFLGLDDERSFEIRESAGVPLVVDHSGRPIGRLARPGGATA